jgi:hypothetical protein
MLTVPSNFVDGTRLRVLEVVPTHLPYKSSEFVSEPAHRKRAITGVILTTQENEGWTPAPAAAI